MRQTVNSLPGYVGEMPAVKKIFDNWAKHDETTFRSSQPYYNNKTDTVQLFDTSAIEVLNSNDIKCLVSLNYEPIHAANQLRLAKAGVTYYHAKVDDFKPPSLDQLREGCEVIEKTRAAKHKSLVYCGAGQGRTGTMITAYAIYQLTYSHSLKEFERLISDSTAETDEQKQKLLDFYALLKNQGYYQ